jgi:hypothetical protein
MQAKLKAIVLVLGNKVIFHDVESFAEKYEISTHTAKYIITDVVNAIGHSLEFKREAV